LQDRETAIRLTFIGKDPDSNPTGSPTVYRTDRDTWVVQGWMVTDPAALAQMDIPGKLSSADPADLRLCRSAFEAVWQLSIPHREYEPV
jgi:hypothetical protein